MYHRQPGEPDRQRGVVRTYWRQFAAVLIVVGVSVYLLGVVGTVARFPLLVKLDLISAVLASEAGHLEPVARDRLARSMIDTEKDSGVDALLILAVIERESRYDPGARGVRGGLGLMQIRPATARGLAQASGMSLQARDLFEPALNIRLGTAYLAEMKSKFGDWEIALTAYNMGPTRLKQAMAGGWKPSSPYARLILRRYRLLQEQHAGMIGVTLDEPELAARRAGSR